MVIAMQSVARPLDMLDADSPKDLQGTRYHPGCEWVKTNPGTDKPRLDGHEYTRFPTNHTMQVSLQRT